MGSNDFVSKVLGECFMQTTKNSAAISTLVLTMALPVFADDLASIKKALDSEYTLTTTRPSVPTL